MKLLINEKYFVTNNKSNNKWNGMCLITVPTKSFNALLWFSFYPSVVFVGPRMKYHHCFYKYV